jgi:transposase-like protein
MTFSHSGGSDLGQLMECTTAGAQVHEHSADQRSTHRSGHGNRVLTTQVGTFILAIP